MPYCNDCVDGGNELSWLEKGEVKTQYDECETCKGTGWIDE